MSFIILLSKLKDLCVIIQQHTINTSQHHSALFTFSFFSFFFFSPVSPLPSVFFFLLFSFPPFSSTSSSAFFFFSLFSLFSLSRSLSLSLSLSLSSGNRRIVSDQYHLKDTSYESCLGLSITILSFCGTISIYWVSCFDACLYTQQQIEFENRRVTGGGYRRMEEMEE